MITEINLAYIDELKNYCTIRNIKNNGEARSQFAANI